MDQKQTAAAGSQATVWNEAADSYDAHRMKDPVYMADNAIATGLLPGGGGPCLDAGCGTGLSSEALAARCGVVVACDYSLQSLRRLKAKGLPGVLPVCADVTRLPFRDGAFSGSLCANTLQHLRPDDDQERAVAELRRVTRKGGAVVVSVHQYSREKQKAGWIKEGKPGQDGIDYIFRFSRQDLARLMPGAMIKAMGFYGLARLPRSGVALQRAAAFLGGRLAAALGHGHMLVARLWN